MEGPSTRSPALTHITEEHVRALPGEAILASRRLEALGRFSAAPLPTTAMEDWRYSRIDDLDLNRYRPVTSAGGEAVVPPPLSELVDSLGEPAVLVVVVDGSEVSVHGDDPAVTVEIATKGRGPGSVDTSPDVFFDLNEAAAAAPLAVRISRGATVERPVIVVHWLAADLAVTFPRTLVQVAEDAAATVIEIFASSDVDSLVIPVSELDVARAGRLGYTQIQLLGPRMWQIGHLRSRVGRDATATSAVVALGGSYARVRTAAALEAPGGTSRQLAAYFGASEQMHDFRTLQDHRAPKTTSDLLFKGVVANQAHSVYTGLIRVEKGARGTNAFQTNRNLVLHEGAQADSVPNLEIEDNDVRCSHASAVGPISEDQRFYLESRGVPSQVAERLIAVGFLDEVFSVLPGAAAGNVLRATVASKLLAAEEREESLVTAGAPS